MQNEGSSLTTFLSSIIYGSFPSTTDGSPFSILQFQNSSLVPSATEAIILNFSPVHGSPFISFSSGKVKVLPLIHKESPSSLSPTYSP